MKKIAMLALAVLAVGCESSDEKQVNIVKGYPKLADYQTKPKVLQPNEAFTSSQFFNADQNWRHSVYSADQGQIVVMTIEPRTNPKNDVPNEIHDFDQFILINDGEAEVSFDGDSYQNVEKGGWILVPAFTAHHIKNKSQTKPLKLLSIYTKWDTKQPNTAYQTLADEQD